MTSGGFEHVISHLFIQWIAFDNAVREPKIVRSVEVKEFSNGFAAAIEPRLRHARGQDLQIALSITARDGSRARRTITVRPDGNYDFR